MINISEHSYANHTFFKYDVFNDNTLVFQKMINYTTYEKYSYNNHNYYLLYDSEFSLVGDVFIYLNDYLNTASNNTKSQYLHSLKFLYIFSNIIDKEIHEFNKLDIKNLENFLLGNLSSGQGISFSNLTIRSSNTVKTYFSTYLQFAKTNTWRNYALFITSPGFSKRTYTTNKISSFYEQSHSKEEVPAYISIEDFKKIILYIRSSSVNALRDEIILRLQYENGCRLGEVLGSTFDDVIIGTLPDNSSPEKFPLLMLRNRISDRTYQHAKNCLIPTSLNTYLSTSYNTYNNGYQYVCISWELCNLINEYIEIAHSSAATNHKKKYASTISDRVRPTEPYEELNHYIFLNEHGGCLSAQRWNQILREYFTAVDIPIDKQHRKNNLNHRFRTGYAMFNVEYTNCDEFTLMIRMRHRNLKTTERYFKPTQSKIIKIKKDFIKNELYQVLPILMMRNENEKNI